MRYYGRHRNPEKSDLCVVEVSEPPHYIHSHQCGHKRSKGFDICTQHLKKQQRGHHLSIPKDVQSRQAPMKSEPPPRRQTNPEQLAPALTVSRRRASEAGSCNFCPSMGDVLEVQSRYRTLSVRICRSCARELAGHNR